MFGLIMPIERPRPNGLVDSTSLTTDLSTSLIETSNVLNTSTNLLNSSQLTRSGSSVTAVAAPFAAQGSAALTVSASARFSGDFDGNGQLDSLWLDTATRQYVVAWTKSPAASEVSYLPKQGVNWSVRGTGDFTGDGKTDILWRNDATGQNQVWAAGNRAFSTVINLPDAPGSNLKIQAIADLNQDGKADIVWRNYLSGENLVWLGNGATVSVQLLAPLNDLSWEITGASDYNGDRKPDILWRNKVSGQRFAWIMNGLNAERAEWIESSYGFSGQLTQQSTQPTGLVTISDRVFSGYEGDTGTFKIQLSQAPTSNVTLTFSNSSWVTVDADGTIANGTQTTLTFTPQDWNQPHTVAFVAEQDSSSANRLLGNTISYSLAGGLTESGNFDLGTVTNTYAPDPSRFNIDLDFRNDYEGFWTPERRAYAQLAASDWATAIANEWGDFKLNNTLLRLDNTQNRTVSFTSQRYVDDLVIYLNPYQGSGNGEPALGGPDYEFGGWNTAAGPIPRVGQIALNSSLLANRSNWLLYQVVVHEIGHALGLLGLNLTGYNLLNLTNPQTATFRGEFSRAANGGSYIPLQSQTGGDYDHPGNQVRSVMSYGWMYNLYGPTSIDLAMLADSGYRVRGVNA